MGKFFKLSAFAIVFFAFFLSVKPGYCAWQLGTESETIVLIRTDEQLHETDHGIYMYYDVKLQQWFVVLDFNISSEPLYIPEGFQLEWVPNPELDKYPS